MNFRQLGLLAFLLASFSFSVRSQCVGDFEVTTSGGETVVNICLGNASPIISVVAGIRGFPIMYVLTDDSGVILDMGTNPVFNFSSAPPGVCRIYAATFKGRILNAVGQDLSSAVLTTFCAELSSNYVTVIRGSADESSIMTIDGKTDTMFCSQDGLDDILTFEHTPTADQYTFIVTDESGLILGTTDDSQNFEGAPAGICYVYGISYDGDLLAAAGIHISENLATACYALSNNRIEVKRMTTDAGSVTTSDGSTLEVICVGDGEADVFTIINPGADTTANYALVITNDSDTIIGLPDTNVIDFEGAGIGVCRIYGVAYSGVLNADLGMHLNDITSGGACQGITLTYVQIVRTSPDEGRLETLAGDTVVYTCPGDSLDDLVTLKIQSGPNPYIFIITDTNNVVLGMSMNQEINFEGAGPGTCRIWRVAYAGDIVIEAGDTLFDDPVSDACFAISDNFVEVRRALPAAGDVSTEDGETELDLCVGDGNPDMFSFVGEHNTELSFVFVITNDSNQVLAFFEEGDEIDFDDAPTGTCRVYSLSYHGDLLVGAGDDLLASDLATACWDLSNNYVNVVRNNVDPGVLFTQYGTTVFTCPGDGNSDELILTRLTDTDTSIVFITDDHGVVLMIVEGDTVDVEGAGEGLCLIWGLSFEGSVLIEVGDTIMGQDLASGCFSLTDPVFVIRQVPYADGLATVDGDTMVEFCTGDGLDDLLILDYSPSDDFPIEYVITDTFGTILGTSFGDTINFDGVPTGVCRVYGVAYTGFFTGTIGQNIGSSDLSDDCYAISTNYVEVIRKQPDGGLVALPDGEEIVYTCPGDGNADIVHFTRSGGSSDAFQYVITSEFNVILDVPMADSADFENAPAGICRVWAVAYTGSFIGEAGDTITRNPMSDMCYALSDNFISVVRDSAEAGFISTIEGDTLVNIVQSDTLSDIVTVMATGASMANSKFIVTGPDDLILVILNGNLIDFELVPVGEYRIYHASFTGNLVIGTGFNVTFDQISDGCYDVSDNFVRILVAETFNDDGEKSKLSLESLTSQGEEIHLKVYPNPAQDRINYSQTRLANQAVIFNSSGQQMAMREFVSGSSGYFDIHELTSGLYFLVTFKDGALVDRQRFLVR